jgi:hypothetical protein
VIDIDMSFRKIKHTNCFRRLLYCSEILHIEYYTSRQNMSTSKLLSKIEIISKSRFPVRPTHEKQNLSLADVVCDVEAAGAR